MVKYLLFVASMVVVFLSLAEATKFTITTTLDDEEAAGSSIINQRQSCRPQIQQHMQQIRNCQRYLETRSRQRGWKDGGASEMSDMKIEEYGVEQTRLPWQEFLRRCCNVLQNMPEECQCETVRMALRMQAEQEEEGWKGQRMDQMRRLGSVLPQQCNLRQQQCQV